MHILSRGAVATPLLSVGLRLRLISPVPMQIEKGSASILLALAGFQPASE